MKRFILIILLQRLCFNCYTPVSSNEHYNANPSADGSDVINASTDTPEPKRHYQNNKQVNKGPRVQVKIGDKVFLRETILSFDEIPLEMVYDHDGNLFFTKVDLNSDVPLHAVMMRNGTSRFKKVKGVRNGQGTAADPDGTIYFATNNGVYTYDKIEAAAKLYALKGEDIFEVSIDKNGNKYIIGAMGYSVHVLKNDFTKIPYDRVPVADSISVDTFNTAYYLKNGFVYTLKNNSSEPKRIKELYKDSLSQIAYDSQDNVYIAYGGGMMFAPAGTENFTRVRKIYGGPTSIAFDRYDNFALGYRKKIYKFNFLRIESTDNNSQAT